MLKQSKEANNFIFFPNKNHETSYQKSGLHRYLMSNINDKVLQRKSELNQDSLLL